MRLLWPTLALLLVTACATHSPTIPPTVLQALGRANHSLDLGEYDLAVDPSSAAASLARTSTALGDDLALDLGATLKTLPCADCFRLAAVARAPNSNINLDFTLRHPFDTSFPRKQYDVFDVRAIVLVGLGLASFPNTPTTPGGSVLANSTFMPNADGYTTHYSDRIPGPFRNTVQPYKSFFIEDDPSPTVDGAEIPEHRMTYGQSDTRRMELALTTTPFKARIILEASYIEAASTTLPPDDPGGINNPVYFLPEGHEDEAFDVQINLQGVPLQKDITSNLVVQVSSRDWQQGKAVDATYPNVANPTGLRGTTGSIATVSLEIPILDFYSEAPDTSSGSGTPGDPRISTWTIVVAPTSVGDFPLLVTVTDQRQPVITPPDTPPNADIRAFRIATFSIIP